MRILREKRSLTLVELIFVLCAISILLGIFAVYANITFRIGRETALQMELNNIRLAVEHYRILNGGLPQDLDELLDQEFVYKTPEGIFAREHFLKPFRVDNQRKLLDPFLNRYYYDSSNGAVKTQTKRYENW